MNTISSEFNDSSFLLNWLMQPWHVYFVSCVFGYGVFGQGVYGMILV